MLASVFDKAVTLPSEGISRRMQEVQKERPSTDVQMPSVELDRAKPESLGSQSEGTNSVKHSGVRELDIICGLGASVIATLLSKLLCPPCAQV